MVYTKRVDGRKIDELRPMEAKAGVIPKDSIVMKPGPLKFPVDMIDQLRKLGLVVEIENGVIVLKTTFQVAKKGTALSPEQAKILVHMGKKICVFNVQVTGAWIDGNFEEIWSLEEAREKKKEEMEIWTFVISIII